MIPYEDLVAALSQWRARKGLPVSTMGGGAPAQTASQSPSGPTPATVGRSPSGPKSAPPPARTKGPSVPPPLAPVETIDDIDSGAVLDDSAYEGEGGDFAMGFGGGGDGDSTSIGGPPVRDSYMDPVGSAPNKRGGSGPTGKKRNDEW